MKAQVTKILTRLYPAYRALWRGWILWLVAVIAMAVGDNGHAQYIIWPGVMLLYFPFVIYREYRHPQAANLGMSSRDAALLCYVVTVICTFLLWLVPDAGYRYPMRSLVTALFLITLVFILRPKKSLT